MAYRFGVRVRDVESAGSSGDIGGGRCKGVLLQVLIPGKTSTIMPAETVAIAQGLVGRKSPYASIGIPSPTRLKFVDCGVMGGNSTMFKTLSTVRWGLPSTRSVPPTILVLRGSDFTATWALY